MKQDLALVCRKTEHTVHVYDFLRDHYIDSVIIENAEDLKAELSSHSPAFLLLDFGYKGNESLFSKLSISTMRPLPYIIIADACPNGTARAAVFERGADACVKTPLIAEEVLAVINAVLRREHRLARLKLGRTLPRIIHKELVIDPMRRTVEMQKEPIHLTAKEFDVLLLLASKAGTALTKEEIYEAVWNADRDYMGTQVSDHIFRFAGSWGWTKGTKVIFRPCLVWATVLPRANNTYAYQVDLCQYLSSDSKKIRKLFHGLFSFSV